MTNLSEGVAAACRAFETKIITRDDTNVAPVISVGEVPPVADLGTVATVDLVEVDRVGDGRAFRITAALQENVAGHRDHFNISGKTANPRLQVEISALRIRIPAAVAYHGVVGDADADVTGVVETETVNRVHLLSVERSRYHGKKPGRSR